MKLRKWLFEKRMKITEFARLVGTGRCYVHHWMSGVKPSSEMLDKIKEVTNGQVCSFQDLRDNRKEDE